MKVVVKLTLTLLLLSTASPLWAQDRLEKKVYGYYQQYLKRNPKRAEVHIYMDHLKNGKILLAELELNLVASKEYFDRFEANPWRFIRGLYRDVIGRRATEEETKSWAKNYQTLGGDRTRLTRMFLTAAQLERDRQRWKEDKERREKERDRIEGTPSEGRDW